MLDCQVCQEPIEKASEGNVLWDGASFGESSFIWYAHNQSPAQQHCSHVAEQYWRQFGVPRLGWMGFRQFTNGRVERLCKKDEAWQWIKDAALDDIRKHYDPRFRQRQAQQLRETRRTMSLRFAILKRDMYRCRLCGISAKDGEHVRLEVDHITPRARGGDNDPSNLWTLCFACNRGKGIQEL